MDNRHIHSSTFQNTQGSGALRNEMLGQMHYGEKRTYIEHPVLRLMLKTALGLNIASWGLLWLSFRIRNLMPPHDLPIMNAIGWYFFFGALYCLGAFLFFRFARLTEQRAVTTAMTHNCSYAWTRYNTKNMTEEDLKKIAENRRREQPVAVRPGAGCFRVSSLLILAALASWLMGVWAVFSDLL